jgi:hypothetical protein
MHVDSPSFLAFFLYESPHRSFFMLCFNFEIITTDAHASYVCTQYGLFRGPHAHIRRTGTRLIPCRTTVNKITTYTARVSSDRFTVHNSYFIQSVFKEGELRTLRTIFLSWVVKFLTFYLN